MKKSTFLLLAVVLVCVLFTVSCKQSSDDEPHTDTAFLVGTWASVNNAYTFTIGSGANLPFECLLRTDAMAIHARIRGNLDANASGLGPNDYILRNLELIETLEDATHPGNVTVAPGLVGMNGISVTLTPNGNKTRFTLTSSNSLAQQFFGSDGAFVKQ